MDSIAPKWRAHLEDELRRDDPWRLAANPYEARRYAAMERLLGGRRFGFGLEIGCAAGVFTRRLLRRCARLRVIDVLPEAIARTRGRVGPQPGTVSYAVADIATLPSFGERYDLVVASEVLYYIASGAALARAVGHIVRLLAPGGSVLFSAAPDRVALKWGLPYGAETMSELFEQRLAEAAREEVRGSNPDEHSVIVRYTSSLPSR